MKMKCSKKLLATLLSIVLIVGVAISSLALVGCADELSSTELIEQGDVPLTSPNGGSDEGSDDGLGDGSGTDPGDGSSGNDISDVFECQYFEQFVRELIKKTDDQLIYDSDVADITSLSIDGYNNQICRSITNLSGIEYFTALSSLEIHDTQLSELGLSNNTILTSLSVGGDKLTEIDLSSNTALTFLSVRNTQLTEIVVSENIELSTLWLTNNQLTNVDVSENTALVSLWLDHNPLTNLDISKNTALINLWINNNKLEKLDVSNNTKMSYLECENNNLVELIVRNSALTSIFCSGNQLTELDLSKTAALTTLAVDKNKLAQLDVRANTVLTHLMISKNNLVSEEMIIGLANTKVGTSLEGNAAGYRLFPYDGEVGVVFYGWLFNPQNVPQNAYTVMFCDWNGNILKTDIVVSGKGATAPTDPTREGFSFTGWDVPFNNITSNLTVTARYMLNTVSGNADHSGGNILPQIYNTQPDRNPPPMNSITGVTPISESIVINALESLRPFIRCNAGDSTVISAGSLQAIRESGKVLEIELPSGLVISIDPETITDHATALDLNIELTIAGGGTLVNDVTYPDNSIIIAPAAHGDFGFTISFTITAGMFAEAGLDGDNVRLFYISADGIITEYDSVQRNSDGSITVSISHASVYILSEEAPLNEAPGSGVDSDLIAPAVQDSPIQPATNNQAEDRITKLLWILFSIAVVITVGIICILRIRRRQNSR